LTFNLNSDDPIENGLVAAGGNSRIARSLRAKAQRRDKYGRWVEMGGGVTVDARVGGKNRKLKGKFVGGDPNDESRGLVLVDGEEGVAPRVYSFKMKATKRSLASLNPDYLEEQGIKDPNKDVNGNYIGRTLGDDVEDIEDVYSEEIGELDNFLASGKMDVDAFRSQERARLQAPEHESYNVVATLDEADTPDVLDEGELREALEQVGISTTPDPRPVPGKLFPKIPGRIPGGENPFFIPGRLPEPVDYGPEIPSKPSRRPKKKTPDTTTPPTPSETKRPEEPEATTETESEDSFPARLPQTRRVDKLEANDRVKFPDGSIKTVKGRTDNEDGSTTVDYTDGSSEKYEANASVSIMESRRVSPREFRRRLEAKRAQLKEAQPKPLDKNTLSAQQLADGYGFGKNGEKSWSLDGAGENGETYTVSQGSNDKWYVNELSGDGPDNFRERELQEFDNPQEAFEYANDMSATPRKFDDDSVEPIAELREQASESALEEPKTSNLSNALDIKVGDTVKAPDGEFKKVTNRFLTDSGPRITFDDNTVMIYSDEDKVEISPEEPEKEKESGESPELQPEKSENNGFEATKEGFNNPSEEEKAKPADQRNVGHWYVDENGNTYPDRDGQTDAPESLRTTDNERFWNRETNKVYDGNGNEILFSPTYDEKFIPIPKDERNLPSPTGESRFWDRNQVGLSNAADSPQYVETDEPQEVVEALAEGKFVKTSTLRAGYDAIKLAISRKFKPRDGDKPSEDALKDLKYKLLGLPEGQQYQIKRAIDLDSLTKEEVSEFNSFLDGTAGQLTPEEMAEVHTRFRNQPIDLTNLKANGSTSYSQNNAGAIREEMPPLASFNRPIFEQELDRLGIDYTNEMMQADDMKPLQAEMSMDNVAGLVQAMEDGVDLWKGGTSRIYVDRDGNVLDGHHRWAAVIALQWKDSQKREIPVTRIDLPRDQALALMNEWANSRGIPGQKLSDNRAGVPSPAPKESTTAPEPSDVPSAPTPEGPEVPPSEPDVVPPKSDLPKPQWNEERVKNVLEEVARQLSMMQTQNTSLLPLDVDGFITQKTDDIDVLEDIDMAYYISDLIERSEFSRPGLREDTGNKASLYQRLANVIVANQLNKASLRAAEGTLDGVRPTNPREVAAKKDKKDGGATLDPFTLRQPTRGIAVAVDGRNSEISDAVFFDPKLGDLVVADYIEKNKDLFDNGFKLGLWHDKDNNEMTLDVVEIFPEKELDKAIEAGKNRNQQGIFRLSDKEFISTDGDGDRGRARKERESQRQTGDGLGVGRGLGQPESEGEGGESQTTETTDAGADGRAGDRLELSRPSPQTLSQVPIADRGQLDLEELSFDLGKLNARQRQIIKKLKYNQERIEKQLVESAKARKPAPFSRSLARAKAVASTIKRVFGEVSEGREVRFGAGEKERLKNITFFSNSETRDEVSNRVTGLQGVYVAKSGEPYILSLENGRRAAVYEAGPGGELGRQVAYVDIAWYGEYSRGPENPATASIGYLYSGDEGKGLGGVAVTFARYIVESSGMGFAHSNNLTNQGANNSKGIEPGDPRRHHYGQSEKILQLMGAPTMKLMENLGWFKGDYESLRDNSPLPINKKFLKKLDVSGRTTDSYSMQGPMFHIDGALNAAVNDAFKNNVDDEFLDKYKAAAADGGEPNAFSSYRLQFLVEELNWKDGTSREELIEKFRKTEEFLSRAKTKLKEAYQNREYRGYGGFGSDSGQNKLDILIKNLADFREGLEADTDFDSRRMDRPDSIDLDLPNKVDLKNVDITAASNREPFAGVPYKYFMHEFAGTGNVSGALSTYNYLGRTGDMPPVTWNNNPSVIARKFTSEQIKSALESAIQRIAKEENPNRDVYGRLDFSRQFATEPSYGYVDAVTLARALYLKSSKVDGVEFEEYLSELVDRSYGIEDNIKKLDDIRTQQLDVFRQMDEYLARLSIERTEGDGPSSASENDGPSASYEDGKLKSNKAPTTDERELAYSEIRNGQELEANERFDNLPNGLGEILTQGASIDALLADDLRLFGIRVDSYSPYIMRELTGELAARYSRDDVLQAFKDAIENGRREIQLEVFVQRTQNTAEIKLDLPLIRSVLQVWGVDTNEFIRQEILPNLPDAPSSQSLSESEIKSLHQRGLDRPRSVQEVIEEANKVIDLDNFTYVRRFSEGITSPELWADPATGKEYVLKRYGTKLIAQMEVATQALYRAAGIYASSPKFGRRSNDRTGYFIVTEYTEGSQNYEYRAAVGGYSTVPQEVVDRAKLSVQNGLAVDLWLDNIDGPFNGGNVIVTDEDSFLRIDGGGGLLSDPAESEGEKQNSRRYMAMGLMRYDEFSDDERDYQNDVLAIAEDEGSFEGDGILFGYEFFLNPNSWHWNTNGGMRPKVLEGFNEESFKDTIRATLLDMTPDKINELIDGMPMESYYKERVKTALISRRSHILNKFGIADTYDPREKDLQSTPATTSDRDRLSSYVSNSDKSENEDLNAVVDSPDLNKSDVEDLVSALRNGDEEIFIRPGIDLTGGAVNQPEDSRRNSEFNENGIRVIDMTVDESIPEEVTLYDLKVGDLVDDSSNKTYNGRVVFNSYNDLNGINTFGIKDSEGKVKVFTYNSNAQNIAVETRRYSGPTSAMESQIDPDVKRARDNYLAFISRRRNKVIESIKSKYPQHVQLANGDLKIASRVFIARSGKTYKYELVVHRKENEEFVAYVREWEIGLDGGPISPIRINKMTTPTHSPRALLNQIAPLIQGNTPGKGMYGTNPRNWFNQGRFEDEVVDPRTGLKLPRSLAGNLGVNYIDDTGIESTGDSVKDAVISYIGRLVSRGVNSSEIFRRLSGNRILTPSRLYTVIETIEANRAFPGMNQVPYLSRNGRDVVRVGDRVRHYAPNGTFKEGVVRKRRALSVSRKPNGEYEYTDVLVVKFDGRAQGTPIVAKNLEVITRADGNPPEIVERVSVDGSIRRENIENIPENWTASFDPDEDQASWVRFDGWGGVKSVVVKRMSVGGDYRFALETYNDYDSTPNSRGVYFNKNNAILAAENIMRVINENYSERESSSPEPTASRGATPFEPENGVLNLDDVMDSIKRAQESGSCSLTAAGIATCKVHGALARTKDAENNNVTISFNPIEGVNPDALPVFRILATKSGRGKKAQRVVYWSNPNDVGNPNKAKTLEIKPGLSIDQAVDKILQDAENRINYLDGVPEGKNTRNLTVDLGDGVSVSEDIDYETWLMFKMSPISRKHFSLGPDGTIEISEERKKYYKAEVNYHLSGVTPPPTGRKPKLFVLGGSPASGKGGFTNKKSALASLVKGEIPEVRSFNTLTGARQDGSDSVSAVLVDPDVFKVRFPEVRIRHIRQLANRALERINLKKIERNSSEDDKWANNSHEESSLMAKLVTQAALTNGLDIVLDAVNAEKSKIAKKAAQARANGYAVVGRYIEAPFERTMPDAAGRSFLVGREVPVAVQLKSMEHLTKALRSGDDKDNNIWEIFDEFELFHREGGDFKEIATWSPGQNGLNFLGKNEEQVEEARKLHDKYLEISSMSEAERDAEIIRIRGLSEERVQELKNQSKKIMSEEELEQEEAFASEIEVEMMALLAVLEQKYPGYSRSQLTNMLRDLIYDLDSGRLTEKELEDLVQIEIALLKKNKDRVASRELAKSFRDRTKFFKPID
jgi:hypothetical protein